MMTLDIRPPAVMLAVLLCLLTAFSFFSCRNPAAGIRGVEISFYLAGGTPEIEPQIVPRGSLLNPVETPTRAGHRFIGWYKDADFTQPWDFDNYVVNGNMTLFARWVRAGGGGGGGGGGGAGGGGPVPIHPPADKNVLQQLLWLHDPLYPDRVQGGAGRIYVVTSRPTVPEVPIPGGITLGVDFAGRTDVHVLLIGEGPGREVSLGSAGAMLTIANTNTLTLQNIALLGTAGNAANPVIDVLPGGTLRIENSVIRNNTGRGIRADGGLVFMNTGAEIRSNSGGVLLDNAAALTMSGNAQIRENIAANGGGVHMSTGSTLTMNGNSKIYDNESTASVAVLNGGGGVWASGNGTVVTMNNFARIQGNRSVSHGGGVFLQNQAFLEMRNDSWIYDNTIVLSLGSVNGGGIHVSGSTITMHGNASIRNNFNFSTSSGGGVNLINGSTLNMHTNSSITGNDGGFGGGGGGIRTATGTSANRNRIRMYDSASITNNRSNHSGGGVRLEAYSNLYMLGNGIRIKGNHAGSLPGLGVISSVGGGVALMQTSSVLRIYGGIIYGIVNPIVPGGAIIDYNCSRPESNTARHSTPDARRHALSITTGATAVRGDWDGVTFSFIADLENSRSDVVIVSGNLLFPLIP